MRLGPLKLHLLFTPILILACGSNGPSDTQRLGGALEVVAKRQFQDCLLILRLQELQGLPVLLVQADIASHRIDEGEGKARFQRQFNEAELQGLLPQVVLSPFGQLEATLLLVGWFDRLSEGDLGNLTLTGVTHEGSGLLSDDFSCDS